VLAVALAAGPDPGTVTPDALAVPSWRVHVFAAEGVDPDLLGSLARPGVVLWLRSRTNTLKASTVARVARFREAYVEMRPPFPEEDLRQLVQAPQAGIWLGHAALGAATLYRLGARRRAVELSGPLEEAEAAAVVALEPSRVRWTPGPFPKIDEWGRFAQLPGARVLAWDGPLVPPDGGCPFPGRLSGLSLWTDSPRLGAPAALAAACGWGLWVRLPPAVGTAWLEQLFARNPQVELEIEVSGDGAVPAARALLDQLGAR